MSSAHCIAVHRAAYKPYSARLMIHIYYNIRCIECHRQISFIEKQARSYIGARGRANALPVAQWLVRWTCDLTSRVQSQPLHCREQLWTSCSHTLSCASVTTLWRYINQFKLKKQISACEWQKFQSAACRLSRPALWSTFGRTI